MTMRLDIVTNDAGELVRREHARDLGAGVVVAIYRLVKLAQVHDLANQAFVRQLEQTHQIIGEYCLRSGSNVSVLFADKAAFVAGQLLKGSRSAYDFAAELGDLLTKLGGAELHIQRDITREECLQFAEAVSSYYRTGSAANVRLPAKIRLRAVSDAASRGLDLENLAPDAKIVRAYANAVVIMRRFFEDLSTSKYVLPRRIKRIAQSLVDLSSAQAATFLGVTEARNANYDEAGRAVNTAILAVAVARESIEDRTTLAQIAMAAMMHDVARPRALALASAGEPGLPGMAGPASLSEDQEDRLPAGAAAVLTALGRVNEPTITRTVLTGEALWLRRKTWLGPVYWGTRTPTMHASIIAVARRYNDLLTPEPGLQPPTTDFAIATLANELVDAQDRTVLRMLVSALGLLPTGTVVQLSTGEMAEVVRGARGLGDKPRVRVVADPNGTPFPTPLEVELAQDPLRTVHRVLNIDGWKQGLAQQEEQDLEVPISVPPPAQETVAEQYAHQYASWGDAPAAPSSEVIAEDDDGPASGSSGSLPSFGSTPSGVAGAMGREFHEAPPASLQPQNDRPDRTVFQPKNPEERRMPSIAPQSGREPTASGNLSATPLPHVLVYMLDHGLTGSVVFNGTGIPYNASDDTIYFVDGVPAKIRLASAAYPLGEVLVAEGALTAAQVPPALDGAQRLGILFGEYLVGEDLVSREALAWALEGQLLRKIAHVANLAPEIEYAYYRDIDLLEGWGGDILSTHPLNPILASVRSWTDRARVRATLNRIGKHPLLLHPESDLTNLAVIAEEQAVLDMIRSSSPALPQLLAQGLADEETIASLVYPLAVTRQFAFKGQKKGPMAGRGGVWRTVTSTAGGGPESSRAEVPSGSRPAIPMPQTPAASAPVPQAAVPASTGRMPAAAVVPPPKAPARREMPMSSPSGELRAIAPAARPTNGPQIRVTARKATMVGTGGAATIEGRGAKPVQSDDQKTVAMATPSLKDIIAKRPPMPSSRGMPAARPMPSSANMPVARPSNANMAAMGRPSSANMQAARPVAPPPRAPGDPDETAPVSAVPASSRGGRRGGAIEIGDAGLADAEAALEAMSSFRLAEGALQRNDLVTAEQHAARAVEGDASQLDYVTLLAWIRALRTGAADEALRTFSRVLIDDPSNERALLYRAKLLVRMNRLPEALHDLDELLSANPNHREAQAEARQLRARIG